MTPPLRSGTLPPARPSNSETSRKNIQTERSAARCCIFRKKQKLFKAQSQPENISSSNNVHFQYSAGTPVSDLSTSATNTNKQAVSAARVNGRNTASYLRYLKRQMRQITSKVDSYSREFNRTIRQLGRKMDCCAHKLCTIIVMINEKHQNMNQCRRMLQFFREKKCSYGEDLERRIDLLKTKKASCAFDIRRQRQKLKSKFVPFAHDLDVEMKLLKSNIASYTSNLDNKMKQMISHYASCADSVEEQLGQMFSFIADDRSSRAGPKDFFFSVDRLIDPA